MFILSLAYLALTIIRPQDYLPGLVGVPLLPVVLGLAFLLWLASARKTFSAPQFLILPVFLLALMMSEVANGWSGGALAQAAKFGPNVIAFFVLSTAVAVSRKRVVITFAVFSLCAIVLALHGIDQFNNGIGWTGMGMSEDRRIQYVGIFNDPNDLGLLFVSALPMAFYLSARGGFFLGRVFLLSGAALLLYGVYLTNSRGALLAVIFIFAVYLSLKRGLLTAGVLSAAGTALLLMLPTRAQDIDPDEESAFGRVDAWYEGLHMFLKHPFFGVGAGNFTDYNYLTAHNSFVLVLAETGLFGYITWLTFVGFSFWMMIRVLRYKPLASSVVIASDQPVKLGLPLKGNVSEDWDSERNVGITLLLSLCGMFEAAFFLSRSYMIVMYLLIAVVVGYFVGARQRFPELPGFRLTVDGWRLLLIAAASIVFLFIIVAVLMHSS
jgi:putative inorganic carbon (HCO3(-)) transporter